MKKSKDKREKKPIKEKPPGYIFGRPTDYTEELADEICRKVSSSQKGLRKLCEENDNWPEAFTIIRWRISKPDFCAKYDHAKKSQVELLVDDVLDISYNESRDILSGAVGQDTGNSTAVARDKLKTDNIKWIAGKVAPKIYGEAKETVIKTREINEMTLEEQTEYLTNLPYEVKLKVFGNFAKEIDKNK